MPSALLSVVLAGRYGCDAQLASKLVFATTVASLTTVLIMTQLLG
jgi:predicted permease